VQDFAIAGEMNDHPEFGLLSPTPRLRRDLRMVFFSVLLGTAIGAAAVIAFSGNKTADEAQVSGLRYRSVQGNFRCRAHHQHSRSHG
jgi:hypothetical protein